jgi:hypothetical protein
MAPTTRPSISELVLPAEPADELKVIEQLR